MVERLDVERDDLAVVGDADAGIERVGHREIRAIELQDEAGLDDGAILAAHHVGQREQILLDGLVVRVLEIARDLAGRRRGHEIFLDTGLGHRRLGAGDVGFDRGKVLPRHRAGAGRAMLERRGELAEQLRELGELRLAGAARRVGLALEAVEAIDDMDGVVGAALLAVVDDVDAGGLLLRDHVGDGLADGGIERGGSASLSPRAAARPPWRGAAGCRCGW